MDIAFITDLNELEGTCYIEICPGKYRYKHWEPQSLFFDEENFAFIEHIFQKNIEDYDHYAMNDASKEIWKKIIADLKVLTSKLDEVSNFDQLVSIVGFAYDCTKKYFEENFSKAIKQLKKMLLELISWAEATLENHDYIAVLGI
jgi:hypothetical protein